MAALRASSQSQFALQIDISVLKMVKIFLRSARNLINMAASHLDQGLGLRLGASDKGRSVKRQDGLGLQAKRSIVGSISCSLNART